MLLGCSIYRTDIKIAFGLWLAVMAVFCLSSSGRIDTIDAQYKYETTASLIRYHDARMRDPVLINLTGHPDRPFSDYPLGSVIPSLIPAAIGLSLRSQNDELAQFLWTLTRGILAALVAPTLYLLWRRLGISPTKSLWWSLVSCFATLMWPIAASSFEQVERGWILLISILTAHRAVKKNNYLSALVSGVFLGYLINYQLGLLIVVPAILLLSYNLEGSTFKQKFGIPIFIVLGLLPGIVLTVAFNEYRYGELWEMSLPQAGIFAPGNTLIGGLLLTISPGKGIIFFSPTILIAFLGIRSAFQKERLLVTMILAVCLSYFLAISHLPWPGGDWCWGPRYLTVILPLLLILMPFGADHLRQKAIAFIVLTSVVIQVLALSLDHQKFYFHHNLPPQFFLEDPLFHFTHSQLSERIVELAVRDEPTAFSQFNSAPYDSLTYAPFGPPQELVPVSNQWVKQFAVFSWPRPWPLWLSRIPEQRRFLNLNLSIFTLLAILICGMAMMGAGLYSSRQKTSK